LNIYADNNTSTLHNAYNSAQCLILMYADTVYPAGLPAI